MVNLLGRNVGFRVSSERREAEIISFPTYLWHFLRGLDGFTALLHLVRRSLPLPFPLPTVLLDPLHPPPPPHLCLLFAHLVPRPDTRNAQIPVVLLHRVEKRRILLGHEDGRGALGVGTVRVGDSAGEGDGVGDGPCRG